VDLLGRSTEFADGTEAMERGTSFTYVPKDRDLFVPLTSMSFSQ